MSSLKQIDDLSASVISSLDVRKLSPLELSVAKRVLKLKEKAMNQFIRGFNAAAERRPLTYYSQQIDEKFILIFDKDGEYIGVVGDVSKTHRMRESLCYFCNSFRRGDEISFVTNTVKTTSGEYSSLGQYCCSDHEKCNFDITDTDNLTTFLTYGGAKGRRR